MSTKYFFIFLESSETYLYLVASKTGAKLNFSSTFSDDKSQKLKIAHILGTKNQILPLLSGEGGGGGCGVYMSLTRNNPTNNSVKCKNNHVFFILFCNNT